MEPSRLEQWEELIDEAKTKHECVCCGFPLPYDPHASYPRRVKCNTAECKSLYNALHRRLRRPYTRVEISKKLKLTDEQVVAIRASKSLDAKATAKAFGISERYVRLLRECPDRRRGARVVAE